MLAFMLMLVLCTAGVSGQLSSIADVIVQVQRQFYSTCTVLLQARERPRLQRSLVLIGIEKLLSQKNIMTALSTVSRLTDSCQGNRPLYVILYSGREDSLSLTNLTSLENKSKAVWLLFLDEDLSLQELFKDVNIPFNCEFLVAQQQGNDTFVLTELYRVTPSFPLHIYSIGSWSSQQNIDWPVVGLYNRRTSLQGTTLKTAIKDEFLIGSPFAYELRHDIFFNEIWLALQSLLDFRTVLKISPDDEYGKQLSNGSWNGIMGLLERREVEATCVELTMEPSRAREVDYIAPLMNDRQYLFIKNDNLFEPSWTSFLQPFDFWLWMVVLCIVLLLSVSLWAICHLSRGHTSEDEHSSSLYSLTGSFFFIYTILCHQGRCVCAVAHLTVVVLLAAYSASLISHLAFRLPVLPFNSFAELLNHSSYQLGVHSDFYMRSFELEHVDPALRQLYVKHIATHLHDLPRSNLDGFRRVCVDDKYTFLSSMKYMRRYAEEIPCSITIVPNAYIPETDAMALTKGSPYLGLFRHMMHKLRSQGILRRLFRKYVNGQLPDNEAPFEVSLNMASVAPLFVILTIGVVTAALVLLLELAFY